MSTNPYDPAFPSADEVGLSVREYFAGLALQGLLASSRATRRQPRAAAEEALRYADALVRALNEAPPPGDRSPLVDARYGGHAGGHAAARDAERGHAVDLGRAAREVSEGEAD